MREYAHSAIWATCAVLVIGLIVFGINSCGERSTALKEACIRSGGQVINAGDSFHCLRGVSVNGETR